MGLQINVWEKENQQLLIISLKGSLDTETFESFIEKADLEMAKKPKGLILDLKHLEYISSMGVSAVLQVHHTAEANGAKFMMSNVPESVDQVFKIVKALPENMQMFESIEEADQYFMDIQKKIKGESS